jgi:signal transduction histidine kinase
MQKAAGVHVGLYLSRRIGEAHGGELYVDSPPTKMPRQSTTGARRSSASRLARRDVHTSSTAIARSTNEDASPYDVLIITRVGRR